MLDTALWLADKISSKLGTADMVKLAAQILISYSIGAGVVLLITTHPELAWLSSLRSGATALTTLGWITTFFVSIKAWNYVMNHIETAFSRDLRRKAKELARAYALGEDISGVLSEILKAHSGKHWFKILVVWMTAFTTYYLSLTLLLLSVHTIANIVSTSLVPLLLSLAILLVYIYLNLDDGKVLNREIWRSSIVALVQSSPSLFPGFKKTLITLFKNPYVVDSVVALIPFFLVAPIRPESSAKIEMLALIPAIERSDVQCSGSPDSYHPSQGCPRRKDSVQYPKFIGDELMSTLQKVFTEMGFKTAYFTKDQLESIIKGLEKIIPLEQLKCEHKSYMGLQAYIARLSACIRGNALDKFFESNILKPSEFAVAYKIKEIGGIPVRIFTEDGRIQECYCKLKEGSIVILIFGSAYVGRLNWLITSASLPSTPT